MLQIIVVHIGHRLRVSLEPEILIGRRDDSSGISPQVDLTPYGAVDKGVSRQHAKIVARNDDEVVAVEGPTGENDNGSVSSD